MLTPGKKKSLENWKLAATQDGGGSRGGPGRCTKMRHEGGNWFQKGGRGFRSQPGRAAASKMKE